MSLDTARTRLVRAPPHACTDKVTVRQQAFFIRGLGFIEPSAARRISLEDALRFERVHEQVYRDFGFQLVFVEPGAPMDRANQMKAFLG